MCVCVYLLHFRFVFYFRSFVTFFAFKRMSVAQRALWQLVTFIASPKAGVEIINNSFLYGK